MNLLSLCITVSVVLFIRFNRSFYQIDAFLADFSRSFDFLVLVLVAVELAFNEELLSVFRSPVHLGESKVKVLHSSFHICKVNCLFIIISD